MTCSISIADDTTTALLDDVPGLNVDYAPVGGGGAVLRMLNGAAVKQQQWYKEKFTITGNDRVPPDLRDLDFSQNLVLTITTGLGFKTYTCVSLGASESWTLKNANVSWSIELEEI